MTTGFFRKHSVLIVVLVSVFTNIIIGHPAFSEECNVANLIFGKVKIDQTKTSSMTIIFGNDFDSERFRYDRILGHIAGPERDGSMRVVSVSDELCAIIDRNLNVDTSAAECKSCSRAPTQLRRVGDNYVVMSNGKIMGTIEGKLPR